MMLYTCLFLFGALILIPAVNAIPGTVAMQFSRADPFSHPELEKRAVPFDIGVGNAIAYDIYYVNVSVGTPPQNLQLVYQLKSQ